jgi:hypothetical protein
VLMRSFALAPPCLQIEADALDISWIRKRVTCKKM